MRSKVKLGLSVLVSLAIIGVIGFIFRSELQWFIELFFSPERLRGLISSYEPYGFVVLFVLQISQVILAPLPGQVVGTAFGSVYGPILGFLFGWFGNIVATVIVLYIAKRLGRPAVERLAGEDSVEKYQEFIGSADVFPFIVLVLLPGVPDDVVCYVAGLTKIDFTRLLIAISVARAPGLFVLSVFGDSLVEADWVVVGIIIVFIVLFTVVVGWKYDEITGYLSDKYGKDETAEE